jgi:hypothetical protein
MLSLSSLLAVSGVLTYVACVLKMVNAALDAPIGYEDERGFHYGLPVAEPVSSGADEIVIK